MNSESGSPGGTLVLLHTVAPLVADFARRCSALMPRVRALHILDEPLLEHIRARGRGSETDVERIVDHVAFARAVGADAVLVTCSTASALVDGVRVRTELPVIKIDEAMAAEAVRAGQRIRILATSPTTLDPSNSLVHDVARSMARSVDVESVVVDGARQALVRGDGAEHDRLVVRAVREAQGQVDVVVLAQASMARAMDALDPASLETPVLSSPDLALRQAARVLEDLRGAPSPREDHPS